MKHTNQTITIAAVLFVTFVVNSLLVTAQNIAINTTGNPAAASALLDIDASPGNNKGLLIPRMTTAERNAIASPANSLLIYNTTTTCFESYDLPSALWVSIGCTGCSTAPAAPGSITGIANVCSGQAGVIYSIAAVATATSYNWTVPSGASITAGQGTTSATVTFGSASGNVCVTASNACGTSAASCLAVTVNLSVPIAPVATAASNIIATDFNANWNASTGANTYYLDVNTNNTFTGTWILNNQNVGNVLTYPVSGLICNTTYYYRVRAQNGCGTGINSNTIAVNSACCACPNVWCQKANFGGAARNLAVGFSIGTKGYIGTGSNGAGTYYQDFWEWDQATNVWTQKANFGGTGRYAAGFSIGTKGYIGTGYDGVAPYKQDFWEWDQASNVWTQKANFGGTARQFAVGFSIGTKGYLGIGEDGIVGFVLDFWEWDQAGNVWTQKANFGGATRWYATGFSIGTKGYIGTGINGATFYQDFWEWDQAGNVWTQKANFGGTARYGATGFSIGTKGYIGTGNDGAIKQDFWEWCQ